MVLTGRAALVALVAVLVVLFAPAPALILLVVTTLLLVAFFVDVLVAGRVRVLQLARSGATQTRLGEPATVRLLVANPGRRRVRGWLRDAWPPSAAAAPRVQRIDVPPGQRRAYETTLRPTRRGDRPAALVTVRAIGPLGLA